MELYNTRSWFVLGAAIIAAIFIYLNLGWFAKFGVEQFGRRVLGTRVSIGEMVVDTDEGTAIAEDIKVYNPSSFRKYEKYALTIDKVNIDTKKLKRGLVIFEDATVEGVNVYLVADERNSNFAIFRDNVREYIDSYMADYELDDRGAPNVIVDKVKVLNSKLHPKIIQQTYVMGQERLHDVEGIDIPNIEMEALGEDVEGIRAKRALALIWVELTNAAIEATSGKGLLSNVPANQMQRIRNATELPKHVGEGGDKTIKALFGRRY